MGKSLGPKETVTLEKVVMLRKVVTFGGSTVQRGPEKTEKCQIFLYVLINYSIQVDKFVPDSIPVILMYYTNG